MLPTIRPSSDADLELFRTLLADPSHGYEFERAQLPAEFDALLADPFLVRESIQLANVEGAPAGFGYAFALPGEKPWVYVRVGVTEPFRRRGVGAALFDATANAALAAHPGAGEMVFAAWRPNAAAEALAAARGLERARIYWLMERARGSDLAPIAWPEGVEVRAFDGSEHHLEEWNRAYNDSFAHHYHFVPTEVGYLRTLVAGADFRTDGTLLAWHDGRCVGYARNDLLVNRGELASLGVIHAWQGRGLGRMLLRWSVEWLERAGSGAVTLTVDGENEGALGLYRSEGFEIARTRDIWHRWLGTRDGG